MGDALLFDGSHYNESGVIIVDDKQWDLLFK